MGSRQRVRLWPRDGARLVRAGVRQLGRGNREVTEQSRPTTINLGPSTTVMEYVEAQLTEAATGNCVTVNFKPARRGAALARTSLCNGTLRWMAPSARNRRPKRGRVRRYATGCDRSARLPRKCSSLHSATPFLRWWNNSLPGLAAAADD